MPRQAVPNFAPHSQVVFTENPRGVSVVRCVRPLASLKPDFDRITAADESHSPSLRQPQRRC